jgi:hypothetical protein
MKHQKANKPPGVVCQSTRYSKVNPEGTCAECVSALKTHEKMEAKKRLSRNIPIQTHFAFVLVNQ